MTKTTFRRNNFAFTTNKQKRVGKSTFLFM